VVVPVRGAAELCAVEEHVAIADTEQLQPSRPRGGRIAAAARGIVRRGDPGLRERVQQRVSDGDVRGLVAAAKSDPRPPEPRQRHVDPVPIPAEERRRGDLAQRNAERRPAAG
jgi:hypothetical protein